MVSDMSSYVIIKITTYVNENILFSKNVYKLSAVLQP